MKISLTVPDTFKACGVTMIYDDAVKGYAIYSTSITYDEVAGDKILALPRNADVQHD